MLSKASVIVEKAAMLGDSSRVMIFLVGGTVRDMLLGRRSYDIDMAAEGDAIEIGKALAASLEADINCYNQFGTCTLFFSPKKSSFSGRSGIRVDIAAARSETYGFPGAYPDVKKCTLCEDLARRDFTVNAMALGINGKNKGIITDLFGGEGDLNNKVIRVLHDKSFSDDPARIFRAVRFEARLGFRIEDHTLSLMKECSKNGVLRHIRKNRLKEEWELVMAEKQRKKCEHRLQDILGDEMGFVREAVRVNRGTQNGQG